MNRAMTNISEEKNKKIEETRSISLWLDSYDDLFSDFDPRLLDERNISDDFLSELKKICTESDFSIQKLKLLIPEKVRNKQSEELITKRLHSHLKSNLVYQEKIYYRKIKTAVLFLIIGITLTMGAGYISFLKDSSFLLRFLFVLTEPAGWFFLWVGFENLFLFPKKEIPDLTFYRKIGKCKILFESIIG